MMPRWLHTAKKSDSWRTNSTASNLTTSQDASMRRPTCLRRQHLGQELVPTGVFTSDQHKPSVCFEGSKQANDGPPDPASGANQPMAPSGPEVMEFEEDPATELDPLVDWRTLYLDYLLRDTLPMDKMEA